MRLKYSALAISCLIFFSVALLAQPRSPAPKIGYLRFWDMLPPQNGLFEVRKISGPGSEESIASATAYRYSGYRELAAGRYRLGVFKAATTSPLKVFDVDLKPDSYFTILVSPQSIDMLDDTNDPKATSGTLIVRNYFQGANVDVSSDAGKIVDALPYGQSHMGTGLPLAQVQLTIHTRLPNGKPAESGAEADLRHSKRATLLLIPDSYGRFSPRIAIDGTNR
jgi:hypothetical protein